MEQVKHDATAGDSLKRYVSPKAMAVFVKAQGMLCQSNGNEPMREYDYGNGGFGEN